MSGAKEGRENIADCARRENTAGEGAEADAPALRPLPGGDARTDRALGGNRRRHNHYRLPGGGLSTGDDLPLPEPRAPQSGSCLGGAPRSNGAS